MFNPNTIQQLKDDVGVEVLSKLMQVFLSESTKLVEQLTMNNVSISELERLAHSLKSCARSYGADQLADIAADIVSKAKNEPDLSNLQPILELLQEVHCQTVHHLPSLN
jgi:two-component system phosphorelay protein LuxU